METVSFCDIQAPVMVVCIWNRLIWVGLLVPADVSGQYPPYEG